MRPFLKHFYPFDKSKLPFLIGITGAFLFFIRYLYLDNYPNMLAIIGALVLILAILFFVKELSITLQVLIFLIPLSFDINIGGGMKISFPAELITVLILGIFGLKWLSGLSVKWHYLKHPISILLLLDLAWMGLSSMYSEIPEISLKRWLIKFIYLGVFYFSVLQFFKIKQLKHVFLLYGLGIIIPIVSTIYDHYQLGLGKGTSVVVSQPFFDEHTLYGAVIAFLIPFFTLCFFYLKKHKWLYGTLAILLLIALLLSYSRAAWLSIGACFTFYLLLKFRIKFRTLLGLTVILIFVLIGNFSFIYTDLKQSQTIQSNDVSTHLTSITNLQNDASNLERINRWVCAYRMFENRPLLGYGPGTYQFVYDQFQSRNYMTRISTHHGDKGNAHSEYLTYLSETGMPGFIIFVGLILLSLQQAMKLFYSKLTQEKELLVLGAILGLITFFVHGLFNSFIDSSKIAYLFLASLAILVAVSHDVSKK